MLLPAWCGPFAPPAPGLAYGDPIGRLVTGTLIGRRLHKTLQQPWTHAVAALEIPAHAPCAQRQDMRGQIGTTHTGPNQKPTHVQDPLQMLAPLREVPSHPIVASPPSAARHCPSLSLRASHGRRLSDSATVGRPTGTPSNNARGASVRSISADVPHRPPRSSAVRRSLGELGERLQERPPAGGAGSDSRKAARHCVAWEASTDLGPATLAAPCWSWPSASRPCCPSDPDGYKSLWPDSGGWERDRCGAARPPISHFQEGTVVA